MKNYKTKTPLSVKSVAIGAALALVITGGAVTLMGCSQANESSQTTQQESKPTEGETVSSWTSVTSAEEAARAAGLSLFGVPATLDLNDLHYANPVFAQSGGAAQATWETPATQLVLRKGAEGAHTAALTDRAASEFSNTWQQDVDGISVTLLGQAQGQATVLTWKDNGAEYGVTWQGLGGEEMAMTTDQVAMVVRSVRDANASSTQTTQTTQKQTTQNGQNNQNSQQQNTQNSQQNSQNTNSQTTNNQGTEQQNQQQADSDMISSNAAISAATDYVTGGNVVSGANAQLVTGGDAPHYVVTFHYDDASYTVEVDAYTGEVWDVQETFNDGTTQSTNQTSDENSYDYGENEYGEYDSEL